MEEMAEELNDLGIKPEQVQEFTPTPMTLSTTIWYTGFNPYTGKKVYIPRDVKERKRQKDVLFRRKSVAGAKKNRGGRPGS